MSSMHRNTLPSSTDLFTYLLLVSLKEERMKSLNLLCSKYSTQSVYHINECSCNNVLIDDFYHISSVCFANNMKLRISRDVTLLHLQLINH
jgi:hypothetical protein